MASPGDFLAAMAGSTAGMVAIVGGLLVSRFVSIDSEQQGARRLLGDARGRLSRAKTRLAELESSSVRSEADEILDNVEVIGPIWAGERNLSELRRLSGRSALISDEQLLTHVEAVASELKRAEEHIGARVKANGRNPRQLFRDQDWLGFRVDEMRDVAVDRELVWQIVHDATYANLIEEAMEQERAEYGPNAKLLNLDTPGLMIPIAPPPFKEGHQRQIEAQERIDRRGEIERVRQQVRDLTDEEQRCINNYYAVERPRGLLYSGLAVLMYYSLVGLVLPLYYLSTEPEDFTPEIKSLLYWFLTGLGALFVYMTRAALRLGRVRNLEFP